MEQSTFSVIARMHSDFDQKFGIPRQSGLVEASMSGAYGSVVHTD